MYSRPGSGRLCNATRRNGGTKRWRTASAGLVRHQYRRLGLPEYQPAAHMYGSHHSGRRLVNAVDVLGREIPVAGGVARGGSRRATRPRPRFARHLGYGWGFSYLLGAYFDYSSPVAWSDTSLNQRFALSYTANDWSLTANVIWGIHLDSVTDRPQLSPCPVPVSLTFPVNGCNPDFIPTLI